MIVIAELIALITALKAANLPFAVCGGLAMAIHGHPRATQDIDIIIQEERLQEVPAVAKTVGFRIPGGRMPFKTTSPLAMEVCRVSKAVGDKLIPLDLLLVSPALEEVWNTRVTGLIGDTECSVVSTAGLIRMKEIAARSVTWQTSKSCDRQHQMSDVSDPVQGVRRPVDMSGEAVLRRLEMVGELNELCWFLGSSDLAKRAAAQAGRVWKEPWLTVPEEYRGKRPTE